MFTTGLFIHQNFASSIAEFHFLLIQGSSFCFFLMQPLGIIQSDSLPEFTFGLWLVIELRFVSLLPLPLSPS